VRDFGLDGLARDIIDEVLDALVIARKEVQQSSSAGQ